LAPSGAIKAPPTFIELRLAVGIELQHEITSFAGDRLDANGERHVELIHRVRDDQADDLLAPAVEIDSEDVGAKVDRLQRGLDARARRQANRVWVVEVL
jgi:hypothetical protein